MGPVDLVEDPADQRRFVCVVQPRGPTRLHVEQGPQHEPLRLRVPHRERGPDGLERFPLEGVPLHDSEGVDEKNEILPGLYLSVTSDALNPLLQDEHANLRFCLGYAGWGAGQIEFEMKQGSWLYTEANRNDVLHTEPEKVWAQVIKSMGIDPGWVVPSGGVN